MKLSKKQIKTEKMKLSKKQQDQKIKRIKSLLADIRQQKDDAQRLANGLFINDDDFFHLLKNMPDLKDRLWDLDNRIFTLRRMLLKF